MNVAPYLETYRNQDSDLINQASLQERLQFCFQQDGTSRQSSWNVKSTMFGGKIIHTYSDSFFLRCQISGLDCSRFFLEQVCQGLPCQDIEIITCKEYVSNNCKIINKCFKMERSSSFQHLNAQYWNLLNQK